MSKESPTIAIGTLDPNLRNLVGIGTIGSTKLHEPQFAERTRQQNTVVSTGSKLLAINNTSNKLLAAATRLQSEMDIETKYWRDVIAVKEAGWPVTLQDNSSVLRVKFGFTDCKYTSQTQYLQQPPKQFYLTVK
jgi:mediator of RNA polymerase II transcription subunit 17